MTKAIVFGPWVGEFSYELSWWNPAIRKIRNEKLADHTSYHVGYYGRRAMYKDFIDEYIHYPEQLQSTLTYPSMHAIFENGQHVVPQNVLIFFKDVVDYLRRKHSEIKYYLPNVDIVQRCHSQLPFGEHVHFKAEPTMMKEVQKELKGYFKNKRDTVAVLARVRLRDGKPDHLDWNPNNWVQFIGLLVSELKLNVVMISIPRKGNAGGGLDLVGTPMYQKNKKFIMPFEVIGANSLERQFALLKNTTCSIYGASGSACLPFFLNTPAYTQQTIEEGYRLFYEWERRLTGNHKNVRVFDLYQNWEMYNSPVTEMFDDFKKFYLNLKKRLKSKK